MKPLRALTSSRYVDVSRHFQRDRGFYKLVHRSEYGRLAWGATVHVPFGGYVQFTQNTLNIAKINSMAPSLSQFTSTITGRETEVYKKFNYTRVVASRISIHIERQDGVDLSAWEFCLVPLNGPTYAAGVTVNPYTQNAVWRPARPDTDPVVYLDTVESWQAFKAQRGAHSRVLAPAATGGDAKMPGRIKLYSTVSQSAMNIAPGANVDPAYNETSAFGITNTAINWWMLGCFCQNPTANGNREFTLSITCTYWVKAWGAKLPFLLKSTGPSEETKERGSDGMDEDPELDAFTDLSVAEPPPLPVEEKKAIPTVALPPPMSMRAPSPARPVAIARSLTNVGLPKK